MLKQSQQFIAVSLVIIVLLGAGACAPGGSSGNLLNLQGILGQVDNISGDITVVLNDGSIATFNLKDVDVGAIREALGDASLEPGSGVTISRGVGGEVTGLKVHAAETEGVIKSLDLNKRKVTITLDTKRQLTFNVTGNTAIILAENVETSFAQLTIGQNIDVIYDVQSKNALKITFNQPDDRGRRTVRGKISVIDRNARTVTILDETGVKTLPLQITPATKIWVDQPAVFEMLIVDMAVTVKFNPATGGLLKLMGKDLRSPVEKFLEKGN